MEIRINENITLWRELNPFELSSKTDGFDTAKTISRFFSNRERISIQGRWFDVLSLSELVRKRNKKDGYYRVIYIQINMATGEYYIGKANRPKWSELKRYQGSGLKFRNKFNKSKDDFSRFL